MSLASKFRRLLNDGRLNLPYPGRGDTGARHRLLAGIARENLALGRLAEAHLDALAILHEAGREVRSGSLYGVWASEVPGRSLRIVDSKLSGMKMFCTGATIVDRALVTVMEPERCLVDIDLRSNANAITYDETEWKTTAFAETHTANASFTDVPIRDHDFAGPPGWYLDRPGFWHGACGPASCWAGGALGLIDYALVHTPDNSPHALAHLGAMQATGWGLRAILDTAGREIDAEPDDARSAMTRGLIVRHLIEEGCADILRRFGRAYGPRPLAFNEEMSQLCQDLTLYIRQSRAECDLEMLARQIVRERRNE